MLSELKQEIRDAVYKYCTESIHRDTTIQALCRPGFALHPDSKCRAGLLTLEIYAAITGVKDAQAIRAATAVELIMEAGFMFDNVADDEVDTSGGITSAQELALAITLLSCGVAAAHELASSGAITGNGFQSVLQIQINSVAACAGQFLDAYLQKSENTTTEESLNMTTLKSGSIGKLAGEFSAGVACNDPDIVEKFGEFGFNLFTYLQLVDDLRDAVPSHGPATDLLQGKKTLPLVYFFNSLDNADAGSNSVMVPDDPEQPSAEFRRQFATSGSSNFCAIVAEAYLNRAKSTLSSLRDRLTSVECLERLVSSLEFTTEEIPMAS